METTAKTVAEAQDVALDQLGVAADEAEFEVLEEPKSGLFGRVRGEARVRARVKPTAVRPKQERRQRGKGPKRDGAKKSGGRSKSNDDRSESKASDGADDAPATESSKPARPKQQRQNKESKRMEHEHPQSDVTPQEVGDAAAAFMSQLATAFGAENAETELTVDGTDLDVRVTGSELGLMVGPGGRTLTAIQDLVRVSAQRRLGDHETRLRIDVGGYREKRRAALEQFAGKVAAQVIETNTAKALEPMSSSDRKAVHDAVIEIDGVTSHSEGDDPNRRVVITPN
ncbi:MAG: RNA-binding cell elongation regulator Jag/EloR [Ilumatobacteraceae bacterium]|nr:RNA-binding cell elongation regulator Jag/EloR [Ilumatobacteraceae bacterium]